MKQARTVRSKTCGVKHSAVKPLEYDQTKAAFDKRKKKQGLPVGPRFRRIKFSPNAPDIGENDHAKLTREKYEHH